MLSRRVVRQETTISRRTGIVLPIDIGGKWICRYWTMRLLVYSLCLGRRRNVGDAEDARTIAVGCAGRRTSQGTQGNHSNRRIIERWIVIGGSARTPRRP